MLINSMNGFKHKKILIICNDSSHPGLIIKDGLNYLEDKHDITWLHNNDLKIIDKLIKFDLLILARSGSNWMCQEIEKKIVNFVYDGGSLLILHSGLSLYDEYEDFIHLMGGSFNYHPDKCTVCYKPVLGHEMTNEVISFCYEDEHYFIDKKREDLDIFLYSESIHGVQPAGWRVINKSGKVVVMTPGHCKEVWKSFNDRNLIERSIDWLTK